MIDFFPIETPYDSKDYQIMKKVVNMGIDSSLEGFTKSKFMKSPNWTNKFLWNIHDDELPILYKRLEFLYEKTGDDDYESFLSDIRKVADETKMAIAGEELGEMTDPYDPMDANQTIDGAPAGNSDLNADGIDSVAPGVGGIPRTSIGQDIENYINDDTKSQELAAENSSDSLMIKHGENLKPLDETTDEERYEDVVFLQGQEADEVMDILNNDGEDAAMNYLMQWHQPGGHMGRNELGHGTQDETYEKDGYIMAWNPYLPYIGLTYDTHHDQVANTEQNQEIEISEDSQATRHGANQRGKIGNTPLGQHLPHSQAAKK